MADLPRFFALLQVLSSEERAQFRKWLTGTYHRRDDLYRRAFAAAIKVKPERYRPEKFFAHIYPDRAFEVEQLRRLLSELTQLLERFLAWREMEADDRLRSYFVRRAIGRRKLTGHYASLLKRDGKIAPRYDSVGMLHRYLYALNKLDTRTGVPDKSYEDDLLQTIEALDRAYQSERLFLEGIYANFKQIYRLPSESDRSLRYLEVPNFESPELEVPRLLRDLLLEHNDDQLIRLLHLLDPYLQMVGKTRGNYLIRQLNSHLYRRLRVTPDGNYHRIIFDLFRKGLNLGILTERYSIDQTLFLNCVNLGLRNGELRWVEDFIDRYSPLLHKELQLQATQLAKGQLALAQNRLDKAEKYLTNDFTVLNINLTARSLLLRLYYLQSLDRPEAHDELLKRLDQFDDWLRNLRQKDFVKQRKSAYLKTSRVVRQLIEIRVSVGDRKKRKARLLRSIEEQEIFLPQWLQQAIQNL